MLELRPSCEHCGVSLPPDSEHALICTYECTFCRSCVDDVLFNVCPNCGGGFCPRPIRPSTALKNGLCVANQPATTRVTFKPVDLEEHAAFARDIKEIPPHKR